MIAKKLFNGLGNDIAILLKIEKNGLGNLRMFRRRGSAEFIEGNSKPGINVAMNSVESVAELFGADMLLKGFGFRGCAIFIGTADIEGFIAPRTAKTRKNIGRQYLDQVAEVGYVIHIRKGGCNESSFHA